MGEAKSGILGKVDGIHTIRNWNINDSASANKFNASNTKGAVGRTAGNIDWTGGYSSYGHTPVKMPGDEFNFLGAIDDEVDNGVQGDCIVESTEIVVDIASGKSIEHNVEFAAKGVLDLEADASAVVDNVVPDVPPSIGCKLHINKNLVTPSWEELIYVTTMRLRFSRENPQFANSGTAGVINRSRGNLDCMLSADFQNNKFGELPAKNTFIGLRMYVTATTYWEILWGIVENLTNMSCPVEDAGIVGGTINLGFSGYTRVGSTPTEGSIKKPGGATYWP